MTVRVLVTLELSIEVEGALNMFGEQPWKKMVYSECRAHGEIVESSITPLVAGCDEVGTKERE